MNNLATVEKLPSPGQAYLFHAYSSADCISFKNCAEQFPAEILQRFDQDCIIVSLKPEERIFIFRYGTVVFFNISQKEHPGYLSKIGAAFREQAHNPDASDMSEDDFILRVVPGHAPVTFNEVTIPEIDTIPLQIVAQMLAQSSALELIEWEVEEFLKRSEDMTKTLKTFGWVTGRRYKILQFLGEGLNTRHRIVNQIALLKEPEQTWKREELYEIYVKLYDNFDIDERIDQVEKMLSLSAEVSGLLLQLVNTRRAEVMEFIIIVLIGIEILRSFLL